MAGRGLKTSMWSSQGNGSNHSSSQPGDWDCATCGFSNFQRRTKCHRCTASRTGTARNSSPVRSAFSLPMITPCVSSTIDLSDRDQIPRRSPTTSVTMTYSQDSAPQREKGLADSLWAPRNYKGRARKADTSQVWIRKPSEEYVASNMDAYAHNSHRSQSNLPDLGLPYEVQHFILTMIQRILEEGCYDFAYRRMPEMLNERGWSCAEAVELSTWRDFLPSAIEQIPNAALVPVPGYSVKQGLKDAVSIRNAAVHRHLCDNFEICHMARKAENLMTIFRDDSRQNKFYRLRIELSNWDRDSNVDMQAARRHLEQALLEINERPVDDMDWTPNAVSLQEITPDIGAVQDTEYYGGGEAMELD